MATVSKQKLTRDQVKEIVGDNHQRITAFEALLTAINADPVAPLTGPIDADTTYTIVNEVGTQTILILEADLVSSVGGPFVLTLTTGSGDSVLIPIMAFGDTILSGNLLFDIYVDASGNVTSKDWGISGSNAKGSYVLSMDGTLSVEYIDSTLRTTTLAAGTIFRTVEVVQMFAFPFVSGNIVDPLCVADATSTGAAWGATTNAGLTTTNCGVVGYGVVNTRVCMIGHRGTGRWRT